SWKKNTQMLLIKKRSRVPGVLITQFVEILPAGKSAPDFTRKLMATTVQEGKKAFFKAMVSGEPAPIVTWTRIKGEVDDPEKYKTRFDERTRENILEILNVKSDEADTFKCVATNEYGEAVCTAALNVSAANGQGAQDFRSIAVVTKKKPPPPPKEGEVDPKLLELLLSARKKDYERICLEFGVTDFRWILKKLKQMKQEREDEQAKVVEGLDNVKQIEMKPTGRAEFSFDMKLRDPNNAVNLYKDGTMIPYDDNKNSKCSLQKKGINYLFSIKDAQADDAGLYQVDVEETTVLTTEFLVPDVEFAATIKDVKVTKNRDAIFQCVLSTPLNRITWAKLDSSLDHSEKYEITVSEDKLTHTLRVKDCQITDNGAYYAIAGVTSSSASLSVDAPTFSNADRGVQFIKGLSDLSTCVGEQVELSCKVSSETSEGCWYKNGMLLKGGDGVKIIKDGASHTLIIECCKEDDAAVYRFEAEGRKSEATLNVQDPPRINQDALGKFTNAVIVKAGENAEWKLPFSGKAPINIQWYKNDDELLPAINVKIETSDTESKLCLTKCQRKDSGDVKIKIKNKFGTTEAISKLIVLDKPTPPQGPVDIMESAVTSVEFKWKPPKDNGGCPITNYIIERQQVGRHKWSKLGEISGNPSYKDTDVDPGRRYCYRIRAKNAEGISDYLLTEDIAAGVLCYPGTPAAPKVLSTFKNCINLSWCPPCDTGGTKIVGYNLEKNKMGTNYWSLVNQKGPITETKCAVTDVFEGAVYRFRVSAINLSGTGDPSIPCDAVIARDPKSKPVMNFCVMVERSGNTVLFFNLYFLQASPVPDISWVKDGIPLAKHVTITNSDKGSQLLIPTSERSDSGIYTITVKNIVGQESFSIEVRITDDPKPPGPVELDQNIPGTVTLCWTPSPDEKRDSRLHYMVSKRDSFKRTWRMVADNLFNSKLTVVNIMPGREYNFRVFAKNDMGLSPPSESPMFVIKKEKGLCQIVNLPEIKSSDFESPPSFIVPLKRHTAPQGYECYMSCAVKGNPTPRVTWYRNSMSLNTNTDYLITNVCGVCSLLVLRVGLKDNGDYKVLIENKLGTAESSMTLNVRGKSGG
uniref:Immunoglobulin like and fibronectin type III domain containing 1, tandem duplicate 2 n=1 Tax=Nothobranchius furzeri TaxID=105023 RepID=A0A8C6LZP4_NOTFU